MGDRRVKIVGTIGPATRSRENLKKAIESGLNIARLNFSHGTHPEHLQVINDVRELARELHAPISIFQDLQGPKIRVGRFEKGMIEIKEGEFIEITTQKVVGKEGLVPTDFEHLPSVCMPGTRILLDDGLMEVIVKDVKSDSVRAEVVYGGTLKDRKGMNLPGTSLPIPSLTEKDLKDLDFGLSQDLDYIALSFVRKADDIRALREIIKSRNSDAKIIAKIEMLEAIENLEEIVRLSDVVMVARGDLAIEVGQTMLPGYQKQIISLCNRLGCPVITATQMLDSMVENPRPTRAEITDVANAVLDGSDCLMLSAETASGHYPFKCIETMHEIIVEVERSSSRYYSISLDTEFMSVAEAIAASSCLTALKLNASAIVCLTTTGKTAQMISSFRPKARVIAVSHFEKTLSRLELLWGIQTLRINPYVTSDEAMLEIEEMLLKYGLVKTGERMVLSMGLPVADRAKTNALRVYTVGREDVKKLPLTELPLRLRK